MRTVLLIAAVALLAGCATQPKRQFFKDGASPAETQRDKYECKSDVLKSSIAFSRSVTAPAYLERLYIECLQAKGWEYL